MSDLELVFYGFCAGFFAAVVLIAWALHSLPLRPPKAPVKPLCGEWTDEAERWTYTVVDDGAMYIGEDPKLERTVWLSTIEHHTGRVQSAALVAIAHNKPEARN